jgi:hypothetical protein
MYVVITELAGEEWFSVASKIATGLESLSGVWELWGGSEGLVVHR